MRHANTALLLLAVTLLPHSGLCAGRNLLPNAGFENGDIKWTLWRGDPETSSGEVVAEQARQGQHCFKVQNRGTGGANLYSDPIPARGDADYTLSAYVRTQGAKGVKVAVWALDADEKILAYELPHSVAVPGEQPAWARFKSIVRTPPDCASLKAHLICNGGTVWWDAVQLETGRDTGTFREGPRPGASFKNLLSNSGFEEGTESWSLWHQFPGVSSGEVEDASGTEGTRAFHVSNPGGGGANLHSEPEACEPGVTYTLSVSARVQDGVRVQIAGWGMDGSGKTLTYGIDEPLELPANVPEYTRFTKTFTTPEDCVLLKAHLICNGGDIWWDDCQIERGTEATAYAPGAAMELLPPRVSPKRVAYTRAIIREARLRDVLAQTERLVVYAKADQASLGAARDLADRVSTLIGAPYLVPDYESIDYAALDALFEQAAAELREVWRGMGRDPSQLFDDWRPKLESVVDKRTLADEFFIFPCFTREHVLESESPWELLEPFGFRIVSAWWGLGYTPEGQINSNRIDEATDKCIEHGYRLDMSLDGATGAYTLEDRLGEAIYLHNPEGKWSPNGNCHNTINIWHPEVRQAAADYLRKAAAWGAKQPGIISYELQNEPSLTIEEHEHGYKYKPIGFGGYSVSAREEWIKWLAGRYGTVDQLNARWRTEHARFEDVAPPTDATPQVPVDSSTPVNSGPVFDFMTFRAESHAEWFKMCVDAIHSEDPEKPVISQFVSGPMDRKESAVDYRSMADDVPWDFFGTHDWPGDRPATNSLYAVSMNRKAQLPHWEDEFIWSQWERKGTPEPVMRAALERNLWRQIAWGKRGISLFNFESEWAHDSPGNWNNSMLNIEADLEVPRYSTGVIPTIERKTNRIKETLYSTTIAATDVALLRPTAATLVSAPNHRTRSEGTAVGSLLLQEHYMPLMIPEEHIIDGYEDLSSFSVLIAPWAVNVPDALQTRLLAWIKSGKVVIATGPIGLFNEFGKPSGTLMREILGERQWTYQAGENEWRVEGGSDAIHAEYGQGELYVLPRAVSATNNTDELLAILTQTVPVPFVDSELPSLEIVPREDAEGGQYLFITNLDATRSQAGDVVLRGRTERVVDLTCAGHPEVPVRHADGVTHIPVQLHPGGAVFLSLGQIAR